MLIDGKYETLKRLGEGGFGEVFLARQVGFERDVAVKVLRAAADEEGVARFQREARLLAMLKHPNVATFLGYGVADGASYTVLEYIDGESLADRLDARGKLEPVEVLRIGKEVASALGHAHRNGVVHRDLKPQNVLLSKNLPGEPVKIIDFGLAKISGADEQKLTQEGLAMGTAMYMSPEQCLGQVVDGRGDLYALGCILYQCLAGHPPFEAEDSVAIMFKHLHEPVPACEGAEGTELEDVLSMLLRKNPDERYQSAEEVYDALAKCNLNVRTGKAKQELVPGVRGKTDWTKVGVLALMIVGAIAGGAGVISWVSAQQSAQKVEARDKPPFEPTGPEAEAIRKTFSLPHENKRYEQTRLIAERLYGSGDYSQSEQLLKSEAPYVEAQGMPELRVRFFNQLCRSAMNCNHLDVAKQASDVNFAFLKKRAHDPRERNTYFDLACASSVRAELAGRMGDAPLQIEAARTAYDAALIANPDFWANTRDSSASNYIDSLANVGRYQEARQICAEAAAASHRLERVESQTTNPPEYWDKKLADIDAKLKAQKP